MFIFLKVSFWTKAIILLPILMINLILSLYKEKYHVAYFMCDEEKVFIEYYRFNNLIKETFFIKEFDLLFGG